MPPEKDYMNGDDDRLFEERENALARIDSSIEERHAAASETGQEFMPQKRGNTLPLLVSVLSIAAVTVVLLIANYLFSARNEELAKEANSYISTEGKILEAFKRESEEKLRQKEETIRSIQKQLASFDRERTTIVHEMELMFRARQDELGRMLERELQTERDRLSRMGGSQTTVEKKFAEFEENRRLEHSRELERYQREIDLLQREKEDALLTERDRTEKMLEGMVKERERLRETLRVKERELAGKFSREKENLEQQSSLAQQQYNSILRQREQEQLAIDRIDASYTSIMAKIESGAYREAETGLEALRTLLLDESLDTVPAVSRRRDIELFIIDSLLRIARSGQAPDPDGPSGTGSASLLVALKDAIIGADRLNEEGKTDEAAALYYRAVEEIVPASYREGRRFVDPKNRTGQRGYSARVPEEEIERAIEELKRAEPDAGLGASAEAVAALEILRNSIKRTGPAAAGENEPFARINRENASLRERLSTAESQLRLENERNVMERHMSERVHAYYESALGYLESGDYSTSLRELENLKAYIVDDAHDAVPFIEKRRDIELSVVDALEKVIELRSTQIAGSPPPASTEHVEEEKGRKGSESAAALGVIDEPASFEKSHLLGVVSSISGLDAVVEPLVNTRIESGSLVVIKRTTRGKNRVNIATAVIRAVASGRITITIIEMFDGSLDPRESDLVYAVSG
jgi:hypothetical protein